MFWAFLYPTDLLVGWNSWLFISSHQGKCLLLENANEGPDIPWRKNCSNNEVTGVCALTLKDRIQLMVLVSDIPVFESHQLLSCVIFDVLVLYEFPFFHLLSRTWYTA